MEFNNLIGPSLDFLFFVLPIVIPIALIFTLFELWVSFARERFLASQEYVLLRIIPPRDFHKTPLAMELFINALSKLDNYNIICKHELEHLDIFRQKVNSY